MMLRVHKVVERTNVAGPGRRFCLWVQGCKRHCEGCFAVDTWDPAGGYQVSTDEIVRSVLDTEGIEGITFLGGEPFEQAEALSVIGRELKEKGLSVVTFTGYTIEELQSQRSNRSDGLLAVTDLLIDGAFRNDMKTFDRPWVGSANQRYLFLTERYSAKDVEQISNKLEVRIYPDGRTMVSGMGEFAKIREYMI